MPVIYKINVTEALKAVGYSSYRIRKENLLGQATMQKLRDGESISLESLATVCRLLNCQPGDILEYKE